MDNLSRKAAVFGQILEKATPQDLERVAKVIKEASEENALLLLDNEENLTKSGYILEVLFDVLAAAHLKALNIDRVITDTIGDIRD